MNNLEKRTDLEQKTGKGGSHLQVFPGDIHLKVGLISNEADCHPEMGTSAVPLRLVTSAKGEDLVWSSKGSCAKKSYLQPSIGLGSYFLDVANKLTIKAGSPGVDILSKGQLTINCGSINITSSDAELNLVSGNLTKLAGKNVIIEGEGVRVQSPDFSVSNGLSVGGDAAIKGGLSIDGGLTVSHLTTTTMRGVTTMASSAKSVTDGANWNASAISTYASDKSKNQKSRGSLPSYATTQAGIMATSIETYTQAMLSATVEPVPIGFVISCCGISPVMGYVHTHTLVGNDHTHDYTSPLMTGYDDRKAMAAGKKGASPSPTMAPIKGNGPSPGHASLG